MIAPGKPLEHRRCWLRPAFRWTEGDGPDSQTDGQACSGGLPTVSQRACILQRRGVTPLPTWCDGDSGDRRQWMGSRRNDIYRTESCLGTEETAGERYYID